MRVFGQFVLVVCVLAATALDGQQKPEATAILAQAREALGGEKKLAEIKTFVVTGRTRRIQGSTLVPVEFEIAVEFPDKYVRKDEIPGSGERPDVDRVQRRRSDSAAGAGGAASAGRWPGAGLLLPARPGAPTAAPGATPADCTGRWCASSWRSRDAARLARQPLRPPPGRRLRRRHRRRPPPGRRHPGLRRHRRPAHLQASRLALEGWVRPVRLLGMPPGARAGGPPIDPRKARLYTIKQDFAKLTLGMFAASFPPIR